ncbi:MAG TPA: ABC transporter substrate-binding protein [Xanthobacteraceae bacterium]|jgi:putative ABC transport system substrate-binding protein|nr:ABC transporter substrate-binding protein [Xanthobacteraceae bacterium]
MAEIGRRQLLKGLGGAAGAAAFIPFSTCAQEPAPQPAMARIGFLNSISYGPIIDRLDAFLDKVEEGGFFEGKNLAVEYLSAEGQAARLTGLAAGLMSRNANVIVCLSSAITVRAAMAVTTTTPIVFAITGDPAELGLVRNLARPEANVTGAGRRTEEFNPERLQVICEFVPPPRPVAFMINSDSAPAATTNARIEQVQSTANSLGRRLMVVDLAGREVDIAIVFAEMAKQDIAAVVMSTEALFTVFRDQVISLSARHNIATIFPNREYVQSGGLISFGADIYEHFRVAGSYTARILKGAQPADLPVQVPTKFDLMINRKTAQALGLTVPPTLRGIVPDVLE